MPKKAKTTTEPRPRAKVQKDEEFRPVPVALEVTTPAVESVDDQVDEEADRWEQEPVLGMHYQVILADTRELDSCRKLENSFSSAPTRYPPANGIAVLRQGGRRLGRRRFGEHSGLGATAGGTR